MIADLIFRGGPVHGHPRATAVAVRGGVIVAVGAVDDLIGPRTEIVELAGGRLVPGFQDAHVHAIWGGLELGACDLSGERSAPGYLARVDAYARGNSTVDWIVGGGWGLDAFPGGQPTRDLLDRVVSDRGVFLHNRDHHGAWVNSRALDLAGITADTPDPVGGRIERDAQGQATGMLQEAAVDLVGRLIARPGPSHLRAALLRASGSCTRTGSPPGRTPSSATRSASLTYFRPMWTPLATVR